MNGIAYEYKESRDVLIKNGAAVARYCIRTPIITVSAEINGIYEKSGEAFRRFVTDKAFLWAAELSSELSASGKDISAFPTLQYLFYITVTEQTETALSVLEELSVLRGSKLRYVERRAAVWDLNSLCPMTLSQLSKALGIEKKRIRSMGHCDGFYLRRGRLILYRIRHAVAEGERLRDRLGHFTEYELDIPKEPDIGQDKS